MLPLFWRQLFPRIDLLRSWRTRIAHIEFTSHCNLRCVFCGASQPEYKGRHADLEILASVVQSLKTRFPKVINVNGHGETTIFPNWHRYCGELLDSGFELHIISNFAKKFSQPEIECLSRFSSIEVSCDSADPGLFKDLRRGAELATVVENIKRVQSFSASNREIPPKISFSCVVSDRTVFGLQALIDFGSSLGVKDYDFCNLVKYPQVCGAIQVNHITELPMAEMEKARQALKTAFDFMDSSGIEYHCQQGLIDTLEERIRSLDHSGSKTPVAQDVKPAASGQPEPHRYAAAVHERETRDCLDPWSFVQVQSDGDVLPCCWHPPVGTLNSGNKLESIINGHLMEELRLGLLSGNLHSECRSCPSRGLTSIEDLREKVTSYLFPKIGKYVAAIKKNVVSSFREMAVEYQKGWFQQEAHEHPVETGWENWRWTSRQAEFRFGNPGGSLSLVICGQTDRIRLPEQKIQITINGSVVDEFIPQRNRFIKEYALSPKVLGNGAYADGAICVDRTFVPAQSEPNATDQRELGLQVFRLSLAQRGKPRPH